MSQFSQMRPIRRAPRVSLRGALATIQLENGRQLAAKLHQLSLTGGLLEVSAYLEERVWVGLTVQLGASVVYPTVEMMFPMRGGVGYLQPFRITRMRAEERQLLEREITNLRKQAMAGQSIPGRPAGLGSANSISASPISASPGSGHPPRVYLESF